MKKILILLLVLLTSGSAYGQHHDARVRKDRHRKEQMHNPRNRDHKPDRRKAGRKMENRWGNGPREVPCTQEWQELWNGCHVRLIGNRVCIYDDRDDRIISGEAVSLMPSGDYKVRLGDYWRIYTSRGDWTAIYGTEIYAWEHGFYCVRQSDMWRVYTRDGDRLMIWSREHISQLWNGCFLYEQGGKYYVADEKGDRIFNVWGDSVDLMDNGLFRCSRGGRYYYVDREGNSRM